jgi:hypothetical protein
MKRQITSISIDPAIWDQFKITCTAMGQNYSKAFESLLYDYIIINKAIVNEIILKNNQIIYAK